MTEVSVEPQSWLAGDDGFAIRGMREGGELVLELSGELDIASAPTLENELACAERSDARRIVVDLGGLDFTDASGLRVLLLASQRAAADSNRLRIIRRTGQVARIMRLTGVDQRLACSTEARREDVFVEPPRSGSGGS